MVKDDRNPGWRFAVMSPSPLGSRFCLCTRRGGADRGRLCPKGIQSNLMKGQAAWTLETPGGLVIGSATGHHPTTPPTGLLEPLCPLRDAP